MGRENSQTEDPFPPIIPPVKEHPVIKKKLFGILGPKEHVVWYIFEGSDMELEVYQYQ